MICVNSDSNSPFTTPPNTSKEPWKGDFMMNKVECILHDLGVGRHYKGYDLACHAIRLAIDEPSRLCNMKKHLFTPMAALFRCNERSIERNLRTLIRRAWDNDAEAMRQAAGYRLLWCPSVSEFLSLMVDCALEIQPPLEAKRNRC